MALLDLWNKSPDQLRDKQIQQLIAFAGTGKLLDGSDCSAELRAFLAMVPSSALAAYADQCLAQSFTDSGLALQDVINEVGTRLGADVTPGRYRGKSSEAGFDGLWAFPNGQSIVIEVKTTDAYRIDLNTIAEYRRLLVDENWNIAFYMSLLALLFARIAQGCDQPSAIREATPKEIRSFFKAKKMKVLTFLGYSAAEYENKEAMLKQAARILDEFDPRATIVNIGATPEGIGAVYETAKRKGFLTTGIVSTQAKKNDIKLSPCVDAVFYVRDATWGGFTPGTERLSPTSTAMVENSDVIVAIGGGEVSRDELIAAKRLSKNAQFIPADMNHEITRERARERGRTTPTDFRGAAGTVF